MSPEGALLAWAGGGALAFWLLWVFYVAVMSLRERRDAGQLHGAARALGYLTLLVGWLLDCAVNVAVMSIVLLEPPRELTVTARLRRLIPQGGWRARVAKAICTRLLDPFDQGHCGG